MIENWKALKHSTNQYAFKPESQELENFEQAFSRAIAQKHPNYQYNLEVLVKEMIKL